MAITPPPSNSRPLVWALGAGGLIAVALIAKSQFGDHPKGHHRAVADSEETAPDTQPLGQGHTDRTDTGKGQAAPTVIARATAATPSNDDPRAYLDQRFPNQITPEVRSLAADNEAKLREMFPKYKAEQERAEAEAKAQGLPPPSPEAP